MGLLDELRRQADGIRDDARGARQRREENLAATESAAARMFKYFVDLFKQLEVIRPANPTAYAIPHFGTLEGLKLAEAFADYRRKMLGDRQVYDYLSFMITWAAEPPMVVTRDMPNTVKAARDALWQYGLRAVEEEVRLPGAGTQKVVFTLPRKLVTHMTVTVNYEDATLDVATRNLMRLGQDDFRFPAASVTETLVEELARATLGQRSTLARYRTVLPARGLQATGRHQVTDL